MENEFKLAIIGGSGAYNLLDDIEYIKNFETPFGISQPFAIGYIGNKRIVYTNRHSLPGSKNFGHDIPPHRINSKALIFSIAKLKIKKIISILSVGSLRKEFAIGSFIVPEQFIDFTKKRDYTFFDGKFIGSEGVIIDENQVKHIDVTKPFCDELRNLVYEKGKKLNIDIRICGCYVCTEGPRLETPAEIAFYRNIGGDVVGMTLIPECILAKELDICYAPVCIVTNYAAGMQEKVSLEEVKKVTKNVEGKLKLLLKNVIEEF
jgi:5'-methylthioadenosine phosphorylase